MSKKNTTFVPKFNNSPQMNFRTTVNIPHSAWGIEHKDRLLLLGSCFADDMSAHLIRGGFQVSANPFGTLYNPASIAETLTRLLDNRPFSSDDILHFGAEGYGTWYAHSLLSRPTADEALREINGTFRTAAKWLRGTDVLCLTFGTAWVYRLADSRTLVANCHHEPAARFVRERLSVEEIVAIWKPLLERLQTALPNLRIVFTVSPIRHLRDGAHQNQLSKATLLLAVEQLLNQRTTGDDKASPVSYFPAYELILDELRDYRFYADDMTHPSSLAVEYIRERFADTFFNEPTRRLAAQFEEVYKALEHRPLHPDSPEYLRFQKQALSQLVALQDQVKVKNL